MASTSSETPNEDPSTTKMKKKKQKSKKKKKKKPSRKKGNGGSPYWKSLLDFASSGGPVATVIKTNTKERDLSLLKLLKNEDMDTTGLRNCDKNRLCTMWAWKCLYGSATVTRAAINKNNYGMFEFKMVLNMIVTGHLVGLLAREIDKDFANLVCGQVKKLEQMVEKLDIELPVFSNPPTKIQRFFNLNLCLPEQIRWSLVPISGHLESFLKFTEDSLLDLIYDIPGGE